MSQRLAIPLFPLPNVVHFPATELRLHVFEPRYRQLVTDLAERAEDQRFIGMALLKTGASKSGLPPIHSHGTLGLLTDVEYLSDGRSNIRLEGSHRFRIDRELPSAHPYRQALVRLLEEPEMLEEAPGVVALRRELHDVALALASEAKSPDSLVEDRSSNQPGSFEVLVNRLCAAVDLPVQRKLELLCDPLPERALNLLTVLRGRKQTLDLLRPFRHLQGGAPNN